MVVVVAMMVGLPVPFVQKTVISTLAVKLKALKAERLLFSHYLADTATCKFSLINFN